MQFRSFVSVVLAASAAAALGGYGSPCALVSSSAAAVLATAPAATPTVDGQLAYDCLNSVPLHQPEALELLDSILPYLDWQTDASYLEAPPPTYLEPAFDLSSAFASIRSKLTSRAYANEYQFQADLFRTFNLAHDGHFRFFPDLLTKALRFARNVGVVSVSLDGKAEPQVYLHADVDAYNAGAAHPSPVKTINGQDAVSFLNDWAQKGALNDPDALYNSVMYSRPFGADLPGWDGYFAGSGRFGYIWPGLDTTIGFQNGTFKSYHTTSGVIGNFSGVTDGESFYQQFCTDQPTPAASSPPATTTPATAPGYPSPVIISSDTVVSGYYLDSYVNSDVAVLSMLSFEPNLPSEFQAVVQHFLAAAKAAGKKKLVIDVSANGGGYILQGYDTFRQLFPQILQDGFTRFRNTATLEVMAEETAQIIPGDYNPATASADLINLFESFANYRYDNNINDQPFHSDSDKFGPVTYNGDNFTHIIRWDLNDPLTTINATFGMGMEITGYGTRRNFTQPFAAEDIILLYDGYCASTCTLFSEFMRLQAGIKSIAIGGRPSRAPMQGVGGVKGANNFGFDYLQYLASLIFELASPAQQTHANWTLLNDLTLLPVNRSTDTSVNVRDNILRPNLGDGLPAQFVYEKADCRLFYEPAMITDVSQMWEAAADAAWGSKGCVEGGLDLRKRTPEEMAAMERGPGRRDNGVPDDWRQNAVFPPIDKSLTWKGLHGRKVPA